MKAYPEATTGLIDKDNASRTKTTTSLTKNRTNGAIHHSTPDDSSFAQILQICFDCVDQAVNSVKQ